MNKFVQISQIVMSSAWLAACSGGGGGADDPLGPCSKPIADYQVMNDVGDDPIGDTSTGDGSGNHRVIFVGFSDGAVNTATFRWGPSHTGCEITTS